LGEGREIIRDKLQEDVMEEKQLTNQQADRIGLIIGLITGFGWGLLLYMGITLSFYHRTTYSTSIRNFTFGFEEIKELILLSLNTIPLCIIFGIAGGRLGKHWIGTRTGAWIGATLGVVLGFVMLLVLDLGFPVWCYVAC